MSGSGHKLLTYPVMGLVFSFVSFSLFVRKKRKDLFDVQTLAFFYFSHSFRNLSFSATFTNIEVSQLGPD